MEGREEAEGEEVADQDQNRGNVITATPTTKATNGRWEEDEEEGGEKGIMERGHLLPITQPWIRPEHLGQSGSIQLLPVQFPTANWGR